MWDSSEVMFELTTASSILWGSYRNKKETYVLTQKQYTTWQIQ